jgi:amphi-Trp domain-containing protein
MAGKDATIRFERNVPLTWLIERLEAVAVGTARGTLLVEKGAHALNMRPDGAVRVAIETERKATRTSVRIRLSWSRTDAPGAAPIEGESGGAGLRAAFRAALEAGNFAEAVRVGEEILQLQPDSTMAEQFRMVRGVLEDRQRQGQRDHGAT